jgi:uncharacterized membrane protein
MTDRVLNFLLLFLMGLVVVLGLRLISVAPPFIGQDDLFHWQRAQQVSQGHLLARSMGQNSWGGPIDRASYELTQYMMRYYGGGGPISRSELQAYLEEQGRQPQQRVTIPFPSTASFSPLAYLPQALGIRIARGLGAGALGQMKAGRLANFAAYLGMVFLIWRWLPAGRRTFLLLASVPTFLAISTSLSADPLNFTIPALFFAWVWRLRVTKGVPFGQAEAWTLTGFVVCLGLLKPIYLMFALFAVLLPAELFRDWRDRACVLGTALGVGAVVAIAWNLAYPFVPGQYWQTGADPALHLRILLTDPLQAAGIFLHSIRIWTHVWWLDSTIRFGGHGHGYVIDGGFRYAGLALVALLAMVFAEAGKRTDRLLVAVSLFLALSYAVVLLLAFWIGFTRAGAPEIAGVQGRYFMLFYLLLALAVLAAPMPLRMPSRLRNLVLAAGLGLHAGGLVFAVRWMEGHWVP